MASLSEQRIIGAIVVLLEGLIGSSRDTELVDQVEPVYEALREYLNEKDKARLDKLSKMDSAKKSTEFDREAFNRELIARYSEVEEVECTVENATTASGKNTTKITLRTNDDAPAAFLYVFKPFTWQGTRWVKGKELARVLWVNKSGYLSLDAKKGEAVLKAGTNRVAQDMDLPF